MSLPTSQRAAVVIQSGKAHVIEGRQLPSLEPDSVLIKVKAVAVNPTDYKHLDWALKPGASMGSDFAGDIVAVGAGAQSSGFKVGDAVAGFLRGGFYDSANGAFQEYVRSLPELIWHKPSSVPYEDAAAMGGIALSTAAQALYHKLKLPYPGQQTDESTTIVIWAGSTAVGLYAIRLAKLSGLKVATTASPKHHELLKNIGADVVFDHNDPETPTKIKEWSSGTIEHALDNIAEFGAAQLTAKTFGDKGGKLITLLLGPVEKDATWPVKVEEQPILVYTALEKRIPGFQRYGNLEQASPKTHRRRKARSR